MWGKKSSEDRMRVKVKCRCFFLLHTNLPGSLRVYSICALKERKAVKSLKYLFKKSCNNPRLTSAQYKITAKLACRVARKPKEKSLQSTAIP